MADKAWKAAERRVAALLGTRRNSLSGSNSKMTSSDTLHEKLYVEVKHPARSAVWTLFKKTRKQAEKEKKTPILAIGQKSHKGFLFCVHSSDVPVFIGEWLKANGGLSSVLAGGIDISMTSSTPPEILKRRRKKKLRVRKTSSKR